MRRKAQVFGILAVFAAVVAFTGCAKKKSDDVKRIGILQLVEHDALNDARKGFIDGLKEDGYVDGKNIEIQYKNAQNDQSNCQTIASQFVGSRCDLVLAIATPAAQAMATETKDIPILATAVTDHQASKLVKDNKKPGTNVSGTSDMAPVKDQIGLIKKLVPKAEKVAFLYCSAEANSVLQVKQARSAAEAAGFQTMDATVSESSEIRQVVESLKGKADVIYVPTDNIISASMNTVTMVGNEDKIPVIVGEEALCTGGGLATYGINYYRLGKQTAKQAEEILEGRKEVSEMPVGYQNQYDLIINEDQVKKLGIQIPEELKDKAKFVKTKNKSK